MSRRYKGPRLKVNAPAQPARVKELRAVEVLVHTLEPLGWQTKQKVIAAALVILEERQSGIGVALDKAKA